MMMRISRATAIFCLFISFRLFAQGPPSPVGTPPFLLQENTKWVDSVMKKLTPDERIGQLFMVAAYSNKDQKHVKEINDLITNNKIGGLIMFQGGPVRQAQLVNAWQKKSKVPLMISIDGEWGLAMRLDSTVKYPKQMTLGAIDNDSLIYQMGLDIARQCKRMGIHVNFAPVSDINNNPANPVIGMRSFGENREAVARKALMYMKGLQDGGVLANAKHFPGHGDTDSDSHKTLPVISQSRARLDSLELYPFSELMRNGLGSVMVAHLFVPALDTTKNTATTLSKKVVTGLLKDSLKFQGLVFTDALNMKGVSQYYTPGEIDVKALLAGNDVLLYADDIPTAIAMIKKAIERGEITQDEIDARCRKILMAKQWCGLDHYKPVKIAGLYDDLNTPQSKWLNMQLAEQAVTLIQNKDQLLPLKSLDTLNIAALSLGAKDSDDAFQRTMSLYTNFTKYSIDRDAKNAERDTLLRRLQAYNLVIVDINNTNINPKKNFGITPLAMEIIDSLKRSGKKVVVNIFASPYALSILNGIEKADAIIVSYEELQSMADLSAQAVFGGITTRGHLPVSVTAAFPRGTGLSTGAPIRFKYTMPEDVGADRATLNRIDSIAMHGIREKAYPGCEVMVVKDGKVFYMKSFGSFTYDGKHPVQNSDIYDLASVTKIAATTAAVMKLKDEGKINVDEKLGTYLPMLAGSNKNDIVIREMMAHQAGLPAWIPFWTRTTLKDGSLDPKIYHKTFSDTFAVRVAPGIYMRKDYRDTIYKWIRESPMGEHKYKYSDLGYYYLKQIIEGKTNMQLFEYVDQSFYRRLGLPTMGYLPRLRFPVERVAPTENDTEFRKQQIRADVHDQGAAMLGGVGGHAGLFSDANDLAVMMQLYLNGGVYGGTRYIDSTTIKEFTTIQFPKNDNRRGIGFDKPEPDAKKDNPVCDCASMQSFGHTGFTGTMTWADPANGTVYVFLSNRVYPDAKVNKLVNLGTRTKIQQVIYDSLNKK